MRHVMTLANSIIGVGILAMPFCFQQCGILLSIVLLIISNWTARISCHYLIKSSLLTRRKSFEFLGFHAFGFSGKLLVELCMIGYLLGTCITYFVVIGDLGPQIITNILTMNNDHGHMRLIFMFGIAIFFILPLGLLKNVDSLAAVSTVSIGFYICFIVKIFLESEEHIMKNDWTDNVVLWDTSGILQCLPIFSMALSCQMQLFEVFESINNQSLEKLNGIVRHATWICTLVYIAVGFFGYVAFCTQSFSGNILVNFSTSFGSDAIKIGFVLSVAFSFPLIMFPCRASIYSLLYRKGHTDATSYIPESRFKCITLFIIAFTLGVAFMIPSVELVIGLVGSTIGVAICIMFPAACYRKIVKKDTNERKFAQFILICGFCLMVLGTYANLNAIDEKRSGLHENAKLEQPHPQQQPQISPPNIELNDINNERVKLKNELNKGSIALENFNKNEKVENNVGKGKEKEYKVSMAEPYKEIELKGNEKSNNAEEDALKNLIDKQLVDKETLELDSKLSGEKKPGMLKAILPIPEEEQQEEELKRNEKNMKDENPSSDNKNSFRSDNNASNAAEISNPHSMDSPSGMPNDSILLKLHEHLNNINVGEKKDQQQQQGVRLLSQPRTIDMDAIRNNEAVAAEESRQNKINNNNDNEKATSNINAEELKKTIAKAVDELNEKLAKKNEETKNLVAEALGEVVEKVEQIERKAKINENLVQSMNLQPKGEKAENAINMNEGNGMKASGFKALKFQENNVNLEKILNEAFAINNKQEDKIGAETKQLMNRVEDDEKAKQALDEPKVYEPLSYKTGELMELSHNLSLPLPLALLINGTQSKMQQNDIESVKDDYQKLKKIVLINMENKLNANVGVPVASSVSSPKSSSSPAAESKAADSVVLATQQQEQAQSQTQAQQKDVKQQEVIGKANERNDKDNVEAIRRDILQIRKIENDVITTTEATINLDGLVNSNSIGTVVAEHRLKRSAPKFSEDHQDDNCLKEPNVESLLQPGGAAAAAAVGFEKQSIGRDLKSLQRRDDD